MTTHIVDGEFKRFIIDFERDDIWNKLDVVVLQSGEDPEPWVEIYMNVEDETGRHGYLKIPVITAPLFEVVDFLEKIVDWLKNCEEVYE